MGQTTGQYMPANWIQIQLVGTLLRVLKNQTLALFNLG